MPLVGDSDPSHGFMEGGGIGFSYQTMNLAVEGTWMKAGRSAARRSDARWTRLLIRLGVLVMGSGRIWGNWQPSQGKKSRTFVLRRLI